MDNNTLLYYQCADQLNVVVRTLLEAYPPHVARTLLVTALDSIELHSQQLQIEALTQQIQALQGQKAGVDTDNSPQDVEPQIDEASEAEVAGPEEEVTEHE